MAILAIDQGTSATKALVVGDGGAVLSAAEVPVRIATTTCGAAEQDPEELWDSVLAAGRQAMVLADEPLAAVGLANQGETVLAWDRSTGKPLSAAISWQDRRAATLCAELSAHAQFLQEITGLPLDPYFSAPKMRWLRQRVTGDGVCTTTDSWLLHRLGAAFVTDAATASRTLLLDLDGMTWSAEACACFAVDPGSLPRIVACSEVVGETSAFGKSIPIAGLAVDQQAALFAQGCRAPGEAKCTYGTGAFLMATVGPQRCRSRSGLAVCVAWRKGRETTYCLDAQVYTVGAAVTWLQRLGLIREPADLDAVAAGVQTAGGAMFIPALTGLAAPFWRPHARGAFLGLSLATGPAHLVRAVIDGIAAQVAWLARAMGDDLGRALTRLRVDGGLTRSRLLMQTQADLLQVPVEVYQSPHATALGVAAFARVGLGGTEDVADLFGPLTPAAVYEPRTSAEEAEERLVTWRGAAQATMDLGAVTSDQ